MDRSTAILIALAAYFLALLGLGLLARSRTHDAAGFYLGGRTLGPWVAALAANASSSSAWSLVGVSGFACKEGLAALWLLPGCIGGFVLNWLCVAPRLRDATGSAITLTEFLAGPPGTPLRRPIVVAASVLTIGSLGLYVAAQMQATGRPFQLAVDASPVVGILLGAGMTLGYTLLGGYLAASITDTLQGLLMVAVAVVVPIAAVCRFGGVDAFADAVAAVEAPGFTTGFGDRSGTVALGFALGLCGIGLGYPGQPHAVNKFMGMAPNASMAVARTVGIGWAVLLFAGMIVTGLAARAAFGVAPPDHETALYATSHALFPPLVDGIVLAAVLAAIMSTVDSQLLVCASSATHDLGLGRRRGAAGMLAAARWTVLVVGVAATAAALLLPASVFDNVLFAWSALGAAFGPLLLVRLCRGPVAPAFALAAIVTGGSTAIAGSYVTVLAPGFADRVLSWLLAGFLALVGSRRRQGH
ncbi:MAG: sodium/proline symporter [Planctomycetes bacterium]|nr:sodium/proline symporter [Planctomycetota bacterium]